MKKIMILSNDSAYTYNLRKEVIQALLENHYKVYVVLPDGDKVPELEEMGCIHIDVPFNGRGKNPFEDISLLSNYRKNIKEIKPNAVLSYTIKPNLYGGIVCRQLNVPFFPNITGLGTAIEDKSILQSILIQAYKRIIKNATCVFFQNEDNYKFFKDNNIQLKKYRILPGSGVNLERFNLQEYPSTENGIEFVYISRIMKEKGIDQYLQAAKCITEKYPNTKFHICGYCEEEYKDILEDYQKRGIIEYHGLIDDVKDILKTTHCTIHPTYYPEGLSNVLLESAASGRPIMSTDRVGTKETIQNDYNGFLFQEKNSDDLIDKIGKFIKLSYNEKKQMGLNGRKKVENEFDRNIVVNAYLEEI